MSGDIVLDKNRDAMKGASDDPAPTLVVGDSGELDYIVIGCWLNYGTKEEALMVVLVDTREVSCHQLLGGDRSVIEQGDELGDR